MTACRNPVIVICDPCGRALETTAVTIVGARSQAERDGWRVSYKTGGATGRSSDPLRLDECPQCRSDVNHDDQPTLLDALEQGA